MIAPDLASASSSSHSNHPTKIQAFLNRQLDNSIDCESTDTLLLIATITTNASIQFTRAVGGNASVIMFASIVMIWDSIFRKVKLELGEILEAVATGTAALFQVLSCFEPQLTEKILSSECLMPSNSIRGLRVSARTVFPSDLSAAANIFPPRDSSGDSRQKHPNPSDSRSVSLSSLPRELAPAIAVEHQEELHNVARVADGEESLSPVSIASSDIDSIFSSGNSQSSSSSSSDSDIDDLDLVSDWVQTSIAEPLLRHSQLTQPNYTPSVPCQSSSPSSTSFVLPPSCVAMNCECDCCVSKRKGVRVDGTPIAVVASHLVLRCRECGVNLLYPPSADFIKCPRCNEINISISTKCDSNASSAITSPNEGDPSSRSFVPSPFSIPTSTASGRSDKQKPLASSVLIDCTNVKSFNCSISNGRTEGHKNSSSSSCRANNVNINNGDDHVETDALSSSSDQKLVPLRRPSNVAAKPHDNSSSMGLFHYLGTGGLRNPYVNPALLHLSSNSQLPESVLPFVKLSWSHPIEIGMPHAPLQQSNSNVWTVNSGSVGNWFQVDLNTCRLIPTAVELRHGYHTCQDSLVNWRLEAAVDTAQKRDGEREGECTRNRSSNFGVTIQNNINAADLNWVTLYVHENRGLTFNKGYESRVFDIEPSAASFAAYQHFRIRQTGKDSGGRYYLTLGGMELFGVMLLRNADKVAADEQCAQQSTNAREETGKTSKSGCDSL